MAISTLNIKPLINSPANLSQPISPNEHNKNSTENVSTNCDKKVEKLLRNHKC